MEREEPKLNGIREAGTHECSQHFSSHSPPLSLRCHSMASPSLPGCPLKKAWAPFLCVTWEAKASHKPSLDTLAPPSLHIGCSWPTNGWLLQTIVGWHRKESHVASGGPWVCPSTLWPVINSEGGSVKNHGQRHTASGYHNLQIRRTREDISGGH